MIGDDDNDDDRGDNYYSFEVFWMLMMIKRYVDGDDDRNDEVTSLTIFFNLLYLVNDEGESILEVFYKDR